MTNKQLTIQEKMAYLGGLIDGEGHIGIYKGKYKDGSVRYRTRLCISNTCHNLLGWLMKEFGGFHKTKKVYSKNHKESYSWQLNDNDTDYIIESVLPYLVIKRQQAIIYLSYRKLQMISKNTCPGYSNVNHNLRKESYKTMKSLNNRGPESVETNTLDVNKLLMKIESELSRNVKRRAGDGLSVKREQNCSLT